MVFWDRAAFSICVIDMRALTKKEALDMMKRGKGGFTLVELLIVIMIIGILAGLVTLAVGEARDSVEATRIISDLRALKSACLVYYADVGNWPSGTSASDQEAFREAIVNYLDRPLDRNRYGSVSYRSEFPPTSNINYHIVGFRSAPDSPFTKAGVRKKLAAKVDEAGLLSIGGFPWVNTTGSGGTDMYEVFIRVN